MCPQLADVRGLVIPESQRLIRHKLQTGMDPSYGTAKSFVQVTDVPAIEWRILVVFFCLGWSMNPGPSTNRPVH